MRSGGIVLALLVVTAACGGDEGEPLLAGELSGDYDGNGTTDLTVYRPSQGLWYVASQFWAYWGQSTDTPRSGDYNGDGRADITVWTPSDGNWYVWDVYWALTFGQNGDIPL